MILADTSVWIEFLKDHDPIASVMREELENGHVLTLECIFAELLQGTKNKRERTLIKEYWENTSKTEMKDLWIEAGIYASTKKTYAKGVGIIDTVILLAARKNNSKIWSLDKKLLSIAEHNEIFFL